MAITPDGKTLLPMLEGALTTDPDQRRLIINEFDIRSGAYTSRQWFYRLDSAAYAIGDLTAVNRKRFLVIERDNSEGAAAAFKKIFLVDLGQIDADGFLVKSQTCSRFATPTTSADTDPTSASRFRPSRASFR